MTKQEALAEIKELRDRINDEADCTHEGPGWGNPVCELLDAASDHLEFPR